MQIRHTPGDKWYVFRERDPRLHSPLTGCQGWFVFLPAHVVDFLFDRLAYFEHFHADDVAFLYFFKRFDIDVINTKDAEELGYEWTHEMMGLPLQAQNDSILLEFYNS